MKNRLELLTEVRNKIAARMVEGEASLEYWKFVASKKRANSSKYLEARDKMGINEEAIKDDKVFLQIIDGMIKKIN